MRDLIVMFTVLMIATIVLSEISDLRINAKNKRKNQALSFLRKNALSEKLSEVVEVKVRRTKREKVEIMCAQAGMSVSYLEFMVISAAVSLFLFLAPTFLFGNMAFGLVLSLIGYFLPGQIILALRNVRVKRFEKQVGPFMEMVIKRYESTKSFGTALELTMDEFEGEEPMASDLRRAIVDMKMGVPLPEVMEKFALRSGNKYLMRFSDFYDMASHVGTDEIRKKLLPHALSQYKEDNEIKRSLKREIKGPANEAYIMVASIPLFGIYQALSSPDYIEFMTGTFEGRVGSAVIFAIIVGALWFINAKIAKPIE